MIAVVSDPSAIGVNCNLYLITTEIFFNKFVIFAVESLQIPKK